MTNIDHPPVTDLMAALEKSVEEAKAARAKRQAAAAPHPCLSCPERDCRDCDGNWSVSIAAAKAAAAADLDARVAELRADTRIRCLECNNPTEELYYGSFCRPCAITLQDRAQVEDADPCVCCGTHTRNRHLLCDGCIERDERNNGDTAGRSFHDDRALDPFT